MFKIIDFPAHPSKQAADPCFAFCRNKAVIDPKHPFDQPWTREGLEKNFGETLFSIPIGSWNGKTCYAVELAQETINPRKFHVTNLYGLLGRISDHSFATYGRALQLINWQKNNKFCGRCGGRTELGDSGRALKCTPCNFLNYPRISPCIIVLITKGDQILLAAAKGRQKLFYSNVAGFIEPGETAEQAIAREAMEEVGIKVKNIEYFGSQPWAFPDQLMLAYTAEHDEGEITINQDELDDAQWFTVKNLPPVPPNFSISGRLIASFIARYS